MGSGSDMHRTRIGKGMTAYHAGVGAEPKATRANKISATKLAGGKQSPGQVAGAARVAKLKGQESSRQEGRGGGKLRMF